MMDMISSVDFWIAVGQIIMIDILLGGDNAVVIALACRKLPEQQRKQGILWGTAGAIVLRVVLIFFALQLLAIPFLKIVGALLLVWIGVKLLLPEDEGGHGEIEGSEKLWGAVKTVIVADFVMSVDNVIAIAGAAESSGGDHGMVLVIFGVLVSIPIIVWGSQMVIKLMDRYPVIITAGGMLLGWIAGTMVISDPVLANPEVVPAAPKLPQGDMLRYAFGIAGALLVFALGRWFAGRRKAAEVAAAPGLGTAGVPATESGSMRRILLAVDGSPTSMRAVEHVVNMRSALQTPPQVHLLNVQRPVSRDVATHLASKSLEEYHQERSETALAPARGALEAAGVPFEVHRKVGPPGVTIAETCNTLGCDLIVMGARGLGTHTAALLGSVTQSTIEHCSAPVLVVK